MIDFEKDVTTDPSRLTSALALLLGFTAGLSMRVKRSDPELSEDMGKMLKSIEDWIRKKPADPERKKRP